ncbi:MAG: hypothetical protein M3O72_04500 [Verrucomicrobiota bacterium]|nr:hypothetical protein [Verrucomicrobiota bacterium]
MNTRILVVAVVMSLGSHVAFAQMGGYGGGMTQSQPPAATSSGQSRQTTTTTKTTMPVGVKGYLDSQIASSSDKKFHLSVKGKDLTLTPIKIHEAKQATSGKSSTMVDMKAGDGKIYQVEFETSNGQVTGAFLLAVKGKTP